VKKRYLFLKVKNMTMIIVIYYLKSRFWGLEINNEGIRE